MANIKSQIKRNRQSQDARQRNKAVRSQLKTQLRGFRTAVADGDAEAAEAAYRSAARQLDKAAQKGVVHRNYAANHKSKMARKLGAL